MAEKKKLNQKADDSETLGPPAVPRNLKNGLAPSIESQTEQTDNSDTPRPPKDQSKTTGPSDAVEAIIHNKATDEAVADIVRAESDTLLEVQDESADQALVKPPRKQKKSKRKIIVRVIIILLLLGLATTAAVPVARYWVLNALGVRVSASVIVVDSGTKQPLKNVSVQLGDGSAETNAQGQATIDNLRQGKQQLSVGRIAFSKINKEVTLGWGSNPLGTIELAPAGAQYVFQIHDFLSDEPIKGAEVSSGRLSALSDEHGKAVLTIKSDRDASEIPITIAANGYRSDEQTFPVDTTDTTEAKLVVANKAVFVTQDQGRYNIYSQYIDGKDRGVLLEATGNESADIALAPSPDGKKVAVVSTREDIRDENGVLLGSLTLVDIASGQAKVIERAPEVRLIDWIGPRLVYQITAPGMAENSDERQRLYSYDFSNEKRSQLAAANNIASVASAQGVVYYAVTAAEPAAGMYVSINPDGSSKKVIFQGAQVVHSYRSDFGTLMLQTDSNWRRLALGSDTTEQVGSPANPVNHIFVSNHDNTRALWADNESLHRYDVSANSSSTVLTQSGLGYPVYWITSNVAVYRADGADFAVNPTAGDAHKIADVLNTTGLVQTY